MRRNEFDQPVGDSVRWAPRPTVRPVTLVGQHCRLEPWSSAHLAGLADSLLEHSEARTWTYLPAPEMSSAAGLAAWLDGLAADPHVVPLVVCHRDGSPVGTASFMRLDATNGSVEVGSIVYSSALQRTTAATEAMYLMMRHVFDDLGYRRYEWKCDSLNEPSRRAAVRLGFSYEGTHRQAMVYHGRNRDTAWYSIIDSEWPAIRARLETWLAPENFDADGEQRAALGC